MDTTTSEVLVFAITLLIAVQIAGVIIKYILPVFRHKDEQRFNSLEDNVRSLILSIEKLVDKLNSNVDEIKEHEFEIRSLKREQDNIKDDIKELKNKKD